MNLRHVGLIGLVILAFVAGCLMVGNRRASADPTNALAAFFVYGSQCPDVAKAEPARESTPAEAPGQFRLIDAAGRDIAIGDIKDRQVIAVVFVGNIRK
jgi:hypothetical protein